MTYRIGEVSRILNISAESLRFFEKIGIVDPARGCAGKYRHFHSLDVHKILAYRSYRKMGFSLPEAQTLVGGGPVENLVKMLKERENLVKAEVERLSKVQARLDRLTMSFSDLQRLGDHFEVVTSPRLHFLETQESTGFLMNDQTIRSSHLWMEDLPYAAPFVVIDTNKGEALPRWGLAKPAGETPPPPGIQVIEPTTSVHGFFWALEVEAPLNGALAQVSRWCEAAGEALGPRIYGTVLHEERAETGLRWLYEFYAPVGG